MTTWKPQDDEENIAGDAQGIRNRLRKRVTVWLYWVFWSLMSNPWRIRWDDLRARISFPMGHRDCNILCLTETCSRQRSGHAVMPSDKFSVLRMDRTAKAGKKQRWWGGFMINRNGVTLDLHSVVLLLAHSRNISPLSATHSICPGNL